MNENFFIQYFTGKLSQEEERQLLEWVEQKPENFEIFMRERKLWDLLTLNSEAKSLLIDKNLNIDDNNEQQNNTLNKWIFEILKVAAVFIIALFISSQIPWGKWNNPETTVKENTIEVPIGQRVCITLSDNSKVWLNAMTRFTFPEKFAKDRREVKLDGEALFEVAHNPKVPFIVKTSKHDIKAVGTKFNVYAYSNNPAMETVLINGKVIINPQGEAKSTYELLPNQIITIDEKNKSSISAVTNTADYFNWIDGVYSFDNQLFSSIIQRLERYYEVNITIKRKELLNYRFTGKFRHSDPIKLILDVVKKSKPFKYSLKGNEILIY